MISRTQRRAQAVIASLERERSCIMRGDYAALNRASDRTERLLLDLQPDPKDDAAEPLLERIRTVAALNARLLAAAQRGLAAGQARLKEMSAVRSTLETYSGRGERVSIRSDTPLRDRRL